MRDGDMIVVTIGPIMVGVMVWFLLRSGRTILPAWRDSAHDGAWTLVMLASGWVPEDSLKWPAAMRADFESIEGRGERWRFALGCLRTALLSRRHTKGANGHVVAGAIAVALGACTALEVYGRVHYPEDSVDGAGYTALFVLFVAVGGWVVLGGRAASTDAGVVRRYGTTGGLATGALFVVAVTPLTNAGYAAALGVTCAIAAAALATRASGNPRTGVRAGLWVGLISGLVFFIGLMTLTYAAAGWWTYDHEAVSVFNNFGPVTEHGHQLEQWPGFAAFLAQRESAVALLIGFVGAPAIAVASGAVGGALGSLTHRWRQPAAGPTERPG
jgi:hypothetical protein